MSPATVAVPDALDELLTPTWLNAALSSRFPGVNVTNVIPGPIVERVSTNARFRIECEPELPPGLSPTLCAKGYFSEPGRVSAQAGVPEACFYRDLAHDSRVRTLESVWADVDPATQHGVVITEDVIEAGGVFRDALTPCSAEQTADLLTVLARLHDRAAGNRRRKAQSIVLRELSRIPDVRQQGEAARDGCHIFEGLRSCRSQPGSPGLSGLPAHPRGESRRPPSGRDPADRASRGRLPQA